MEIVDRRDGHAANADNQIARRDSSSTGRTSLLDARDENRARSGEMKAIRLSSSQMNGLAGDADVRATYATVSHQSRCDEFRGARRNREADSLRARNDRGVHADNIAAR